MKITSQLFLWCVLLYACAICVGCTNDPLISTVQQSQNNADIVTKSTRLATIPDSYKPHNVDNATPTNELYYIDFNNRGRSVAYIAKVGDKVLVVYNDTPGKLYKNVFNLRISPDGSRVAYVAEVNGKFSLVADGHEGPLYDDIGPPVFSPDSRHIACKVQLNDQLHIIVDGKISKGYQKFNGAPVFNSDSSKVAYSEGADNSHYSKLVVSDLAFNNIATIDSCGDQLLTSRDKTRIASVCTSNGKQRVLELSFADTEKRNESSLYDTISHLAFAKDGNALAYGAVKDGVAYLVLNGKEKRLPKVMLVAAPVIQPDLRGVGAIVGTTEKVFFYQAVKDAVSNESNYEMIEELVYNRDGSLHAYSALKDDKWRIVVNGKEGPAFDRVVGPAFSPDGTLLVYRARQDGKRFVVVADSNGTIIRQHNTYELVYSPVFTGDGGSVAYGVKNDKELWWKVEKLK